MIAVSILQITADAGQDIAFCSFYLVAKFPFVYYLLRYC